MKAEQKNKRGGGIYNYIKALLRIVVAELSVQVHQLNVSGQNEYCQKLSH